MYRYNDFDRQFVEQRAAQFRDQLERHLAGHLPEDEFRALRLQNGWYIQRHAPMLRVAVPYGDLGPGQLRALAEIARRYDRGYAHFTTRQNVQFNWIPLAQAADVMDDLAAAGLHGIQTSGNCIRNITSDAMAGVASDETVDPRPYCELLRQWSTLHPEFAFLPRKFKIAVSGATNDRAAIAWHDIGLRLHRDATGAVGFEVRVGGGMGRTPIVGATIREFLPWQQILVFIEAIVRVYNRYGRRDNLYKARIKILVKAEGQRFFDAVEREFAQILEHDAGGREHLLPEAELERVAASFVVPEGVAPIPSPVRPEPVEGLVEAQTGLRQAPPERESPVHAPPARPEPVEGPVDAQAGLRQAQPERESPVHTPPARPELVEGPVEAQTRLRQARPERERLVHVPPVRPELVEGPVVAQTGLRPAQPERGISDEPPAYRRWLERNVHPHRLPGYRAVTLSLKRPGQAPGDATADQMDAAADLADRYSHGELRVTHEQNLVLPWVRVADLPALWQAARDASFATPNIGFLTDMIACPGGDFCALANARSIPIAAEITERFDEIDELHDIGDIDLHISGCINSCGHHHSGHIGILGVDKDGKEWYQISLGGSDGSDFSGPAAAGRVIGPSFAADEVADVIESLIDTYRGQRAADEPFIATVQRIGLEPFKTSANATRRSTARAEAA